MRILSKKENFFTLFEEQANEVSKGAKALAALLENYVDVEDAAFKIKAAEHDADEMAHGIMNKLNQTFLTPFDREDIHSLTSALDDVMDYLESAADRMALYEIKQPTETMIKLSKILVESMDLVVKGVSSLRNMKDPSVIREVCIAINRLENQGDQINRKALAEVFQMHDQPIEALKWREIYDHIETAIDKCEDVADILESIVLKNT